MTKQLLIASILLFSNFPIAQAQAPSDGSLFALLAHVNGDESINQTARCLGKKPYRFTVSYQVSLMECIRGPAGAAGGNADLAKLEQCVVEKVLKKESISQSNWDKCYEDGVLTRMMETEITENQQAEKLGAEKLSQIFVPEKACRITTQTNEYFNLDEGDIYIPGGTELAITGAGGDGFSVLVGPSSDYISSGPIDYTVMNCPRHFIKAIGDYDYEENSPYDQTFYVVQDLNVYADTAKTKTICSIAKGTEIDPYYYTARELEPWDLDGYDESEDSDSESESDSVDFEIGLASVTFDSESPNCASLEGYMNNSLIVSFVIPPDLGFSNTVAQLPKCTEKIDGLSMFIRNDKEGPDLRRCNFKGSANEPDTWCGKNEDECIEG